MAGKIRIENTSAESVFIIMFYLVKEAGGDGACALVCANPEEVAEWFADWVNNMMEFLDFREYMIKDAYDDSVYWHDTNENFIFTTNENIRLFDDEHVIFIEEDLEEWNTKGNKRVIKKL